MIPIRDLNPTRGRPIVTWTIIAINVVVWLYEGSLGDAAQELFVRRWGLIPFYLTQTHYLSSWLTPLTSMFMHGGLAHLAGNMWFLYIFGDNVEDDLGHGRYALFYLVSGFGAAALQVAMDPASQVPMVGASGAIAGVLGGYMMLHPRARVLALAIVFFIELPAFLFIVAWFGLQLLYALTSLGMPEQVGGVAFFAHVGGFVMGLLLVRVLRLPPDRRRPIEPEVRRPTYSERGPGV